MTQPLPIKERIILGIDPGTQVMGYGVLKVLENKPSLEAMGIIKLDKYENHYLRLAKIYSRVTGLLEEFLPMRWRSKHLFTVKTCRACSS
jgi:crossover junction endodeoxyribonuclease RuvC